MNPQNNSWDIFEYEVKMYIGTRRLLENSNQESEIIKYALAESALLHTRVLADILLKQSKGDDGDDIILSDLVPNWESVKELRAVLGELKIIYGGRKIANSPYWTLNKMLAHATSLRQRSHVYTELLSKIDPVILLALKEIPIPSSRNDLIDLLSSVASSSQKQAVSIYTNTPETTVIMREISKKK